MKKSSSEIKFLFGCRLLLSCLVVSSISAHAIDSIKKYSEGLWDFSITSEAFTTQYNYLRSGNSYDSLPNGGSYSLLSTDFSTRWSLSKSFALSGGTGVGYAQSKDASVTRTSSQFDKVFLGSDFVLYNGSFQLIPDLKFTVPLTKNDINSNNVQTAEGATELLARLIAKFNLKSLNNQAYVGSTYREDGRSTLLNYGALMELELGHSNIGGELKGYSSIVNDQYTSTPSTRETTPLRVNGGSYVFNSINPSLLDFNIWYRWDNNQWCLQVGGGSTLTGSTQAFGYHGFANFTYHFQTKGNTIKPRTPPSELERFKEETNDGVDQILFQPEPEKVEVKPAPPVEPTKPTSSDVDSKVQVKLKPDPKKKKRLRSH